MAISMNLARASLRLLPRPTILLSRHIHISPVAFKKKRSQAVVDDLFDDEQWGAVDDLIPTGPAVATKPVVASTSAPSTSAPAAPRVVKKTKNRKAITPRRLEKFASLVSFVRPRIGRHPTKTTPLVRRTLFPQMIQLASNPKHLRIITELMIKWKEGRLGTQGAARFDDYGQPKGAFPFDEPTSELFARRCEELGVPKLALKVYGEFATYALPLTLPAARRLLHSLVAAKASFPQVLIATALYEPHGLPPVSEDLPSCALLLSACLRFLETAEEGQKRTEAEELVKGLLAAMKKHLSSTPPMPESRDIRDKTLRLWLKGIMLDVNAFLRGKDEQRGWLETWMARSRFIPSAS